MKNNLPKTKRYSKYMDMCKKMFVHFTFLWLFVIASNFAFSQSGPGIGKFQEGEKLRKNKQYKEAVTAYEEAINLEPNNDKYWFRKGQALLQSKDQVDAAINAFKKVTEVNPNFAGAFNMLSKCYMKQKKIPEAIDALQKAYKVESDQDRKVKYKVLAAKLFLNLDKPSDALKELQDAKALRPNHTQVLYTEGEIYARDGKWDQAIDSYNKASSVAKQAGKTKEVGRFKMSSAYAYYKAGKTADYEREKKELEGNPGWRPYVTKLQKKIKGETGAAKELRLARAYVACNDFEEAKRYINQAIQGGKGLPLAYKMLAQVHIKAGETSMATTALTKAAAAETNPAELSKIYASMIKLQLNGQQYEPALSTATKILQSKPGDINVTYYKAISEYKLQQYSQCINSLESILKATPPSGKNSDVSNAKYYFLMGLAAKKSNQNAKAIEAFGKAKFGSFKAAAEAESQGLSGR